MKEKYTVYIFGDCDLAGKLEKAASRTISPISGI